MASLSAETWGRPVTTVANKTLTPNADIAAGTDEFLVDIYGTVNSLSKLLIRVRIPVEFKGYEFRVGSQFLLFPGSAGNYTAGGSTPTNAAAVKTSNVSYSPFLNLDNFYEAAGDNT